MKTRVYYFDQLDNVDVSQINDDAVVLIGENRSTVHVKPYRHVGGIRPAYQYDEYETNVFFVKNNQFIIENDANITKQISYKFCDKKWNEMKEKRQKNGIIMVEKKPFTASRTFYDEVEHLLFINSIPYIQVTLYLSEDGKSLSLNGIMKEGEITQNDNIHPTLKEYLRRKDDPTYDLLTLFQQIKTSPDFKRYNALYQDGGIPIGFGLKKGRAHEVSIDEMIHIFNNIKGTEVTLADKQRLVTKYFSVQREAYLHQVTQNQDKNGFLIETHFEKENELINLKNDILLHVNANEIQALVNNAFDAIYPDIEVEKGEGLHFRKNAISLISMKIAQEHDSAESKAFWCALACCAFIVTIPFVTLIKKAFLNKFLAETSLQQVTLDEEQHNTYMTMKQSLNLNKSKVQVSEDSTLTKNNLFNIYGELRKFNLSEGNLYGRFTSEWGGTAEQGTRLKCKINLHLLTEASDIFSRGLNNISQDELNKIYKSYNHACNLLQVTSLSPDSFANEDQSENIKNIFVAAKEMLRNYIDESKNNSEEKFQKVVGYSRI